MTVVILNMAIIAVTIGLAGLITCVKDAISLEQRIARGARRDRQARKHEPPIIAEHERREHDQEAR